MRKGINRRCFTSCFVVTTLFMTLLAPSGAGAARAPVRVLTLDWTSQIVVSHIIGKLLTQLGHPVTYVSEAADSQWFMLSSGEADLQVEVWEGSMAKEMESLTRRGLVIDAGTHAALTREEWWYPEYVKAMCPGLPDWQALKRCAGLFAVAGSARGSYYSGPWEKRDRARIGALDLPFDVITLRDGDALREVLVEAVAERRPIVLFNWTPNWVESVYHGEFVEFPAYARECETEPEWGVNKELTWDCGNPRDGWLKKAVSRQLPENWPCAYQLIRNISFENADIAEAAALVDVGGLSYHDAASEWLNNHEPTWRSWVEGVGCTAEDAP